MGRFMVRDAPFRGIRSDKELVSVLDVYDCRSEWPPKAASSYTRYFLPQAFEYGFRMASCGAILWDIFDELGLPKT